MSIKRRLAVALPCSILFFMTWGCSPSRQASSQDAQPIDLQSTVEHLPQPDLVPAPPDSLPADTSMDGHSRFEVSHTDGAVWTLVWSDEFTGPEVDTRTWNIEDQFVEKNGELQYYRPKNVFIEDGALVLESRRESFGGKPYTSGSVTSQNKKTFKYGRISARIKMPAVAGMWPAFWMLGAKGDWPSCGEIDIMEAKGREPAVIYGTTHWGPLVGGNHPNYGKTFQFPSGQDITGWHEYTLEWNQRLLTFWVDDFPIYLAMNTIAPFNQDFYLILNLAVGGMFDNYLEPPQTFTAQRMLVDYVRVYQPAPDSQ